jgi:hypothetical protein
MASIWASADKRSAMSALLSVTGPVGALTLGWMQSYGSSSIGVQSYALTIDRLMLRQRAAEFRDNMRTFRFDFKDFVVATASFSRGNNVPYPQCSEHLPVSEELILIQSAKAGPINDLAGGPSDSPGGHR